jgi:hypothetical protein
MKSNSPNGNQQKHILSLLASRLHKLCNLPLDPSTTGQSGESISVLHKTKWVEILLVRKASTLDLIFIEVDISMPVVSPFANSVDFASLPEAMITHMNYLQILMESGFALQVVGEEGLWVATKQFEGVPESDVIKLLVPPLTDQ